MKHTYLFPRLAGAPAGIPGHRVLNLRPRKGVDGQIELITAMPPATFASLKGHRAVCRLGRKLLVAAGKALATIDDSEPSAIPVAGQSALPGEPLCSLATSSAEAIVMTDMGPAKVSESDGLPAVEACTGEYPAVSLRAVQVSVAAATVSARTLSKTYADGHRLTATDRSALVGDLEAAYLEAAAKAAAQGCMVQPALARYRLTGLRGQILFESPPVLLALPEVSQCAGTVDVRCDDGRNTYAYELQLKAWRIEATVEAGAAPEVAAVELMVSPQFHPYGSDGEGTAVLVRDGTGYKIRVGLPGAHAGASAPLLMKAIARMEAIESCAGRLNSPFSGVKRSFTPVYSPEADALTAMRSLMKALGRKVDRADFTEALLSAPHTFSAPVVASDGLLTAWGAPKVMRYPGYPPAIMAASTADKAWHATVVVRFDGRRAVSRYVEGNGDCPESLNAVLSYPAPDARSMTVIMSAAGETRRLDCDLTPDESGRRAVCVSADLRPHVLKSVSAAAVIDIENADECFDDIIATARADDPLHVTGVVRHGAGAVRALAAVRGAEQAWDRGRSRFFAGCEGGIISLGVTSSGSCVARVADSRGISRREAFAAGGDSVFALVESSSGRVPLELSARGKVKALAPEGDYSMLAYDRCLSELWAIKTHGGADIFTSAGMYSRSCPVYTGLTDIAGEYFCMHSGGIDRPELPASSGKVQVEYADSFSPAGRDPFGLHSLCADFESGDIGGTLVVSAADGAGGCRRPIVERSFAGAVKSPMEIRCAGAPARTLAVRLSAVADSSTIVRSFKFRLPWKRE